MSLRDWLIKRFLTKEAESMWNYLKGKKTYLLAFMGAVYFVSAAATGHLSWKEAIDGLWASGLASALRNGMK